jgi:ferric-dicitrate binding protein FerR (iron transport regulator)
VTISPEPRLDELFVRYWDNRLSAAEAGELQSRLAADASARKAFEFLCMQAVAAAEHASFADARPAKMSESRRWSRRRVLQYLGGGVAAGIMAAAVGRRFWPAEEETLVRVTAANGEVTLRTPGGQLVPPEGMVAAGSTVSTVGPNASAMLNYPDGTEVSLAGDSAITVSARGRKLSILRGTVTANVARQPADAEPLTLSTTDATVTRLSAVAFTIGRALHSTEVGVETGRVTVADAAGEPLEIVHGGEYMTVNSDGGHRKQAIEPTPEVFKLEMATHLPDGWNVGKHKIIDGVPNVLPELWFDPYHKAEMYQVRSDQDWHRGFFRLHPDTPFHIRFWVDRPGPSQLCICVRTDRLSCSDTGMLECNDAFLNAEPKTWQTRTVRAGEMLANKHTPNFGPPWVGFLYIFNTYKEDLGLKIAEFRVG